MTAPQKSGPEQIEMFTGHDLVFGPVRTGRTSNKVQAEAAQPEQSPTARRVAERLRIAHEALADLERKTTAKRAHAGMRRRV
jgi:hypothetical protein